MNWATRFMLNLLSCWSLTVLSILWSISVCTVYIRGDQILCPSCVNDFKLLVEISSLLISFLIICVKVEILHQNILRMIFTGSILSHSNFLHKFFFSLAELVFIKIEFVYIWLKRGANFFLKYFLDLFVTTPKLHPRMFKY